VAARHPRASNIEATELAERLAAAGLARATRRFPRASNIEATELADRLAAAGLALATRRFLAGLYATEPGWNDRLFRAAADMQGCGFAPAEALPLLLQGARPRAQEDAEIARRTIASAYSQARLPARDLAAAGGGLHVHRRGFRFSLVITSDAPPTREGA